MYGKVIRASFAVLNVAVLLTSQLAAAEVIRACVMDASERPMGQVTLELFERQGDEPLDGTDVVSSSSPGEHALECTPIEDPFDILRSLARLAVAQHAGGGESDQDWIRGFDVDHGTDLVTARAPRLELQAGASPDSEIALSGNLLVRLVSDHPIVEDGTVNAENYAFTDFDTRYALSSKLSIVVELRNLFDSEARDAQSYFESRLRSEPAPVLDDPFAPGSSFNYRIGFEYRFGSHR